jgi:hypothetical protein
MAQGAAGNALIALLSTHDREEMLPHLEELDVAVRHDVISTGPPDLLRYTQGLLTQVSQSAACNRVHPVEERCARSLLSTHDSLGGESFMLTQEFLAECSGYAAPASLSLPASFNAPALFVTAAAGFRSSIAPVWRARLANVTA